MVLQLNLTGKEAFPFMFSSKTSTTKAALRYAITPSTPEDDVASLAKSGLEIQGQNPFGGNISNASNEDWFERDEGLLRAEIGVQATILYLAIFGNSVVLLVLRLRRQKLSRMQWFIAHLAIADLFVALFNILPQLIWDVTIKFYGNDVLCRGVKYFQVVAMYASSYVLVMAAIDRYLSICHPLTSQTLSPKRVHLMIALAWSVSLILSIPQIFIFSLKIFSEGSFDCYGDFIEGWGMQAYITWIFLSDYAIPFLILAFCYGRICHVVWASVGSKETAVYVSVRNGNHEPSDKSFKMKISFRRMREGTNTSVQSRDRSDAGSIVTPLSTSKKPRGHRRGVSRSKIKTIKLTLTVVLCYLFCWAPFFVVQMWTAFDTSAHVENPVIVIIMLLASLNSCTNPWIYLAFSGRPCQRGPASRHASRSWAPSTHVTSGDSIETKTRTSLIDLSHIRLSTRGGSPRLVETKGASQF